MSFRSYITYEEYTELGGSLPEETFNILERKAQRMIDSVTFDRLKYLAIVPEVVKEVLTEYIDLMNKSSLYNTQTSGISEDNNIVQYSNSVETITYNRRTMQEANKELQTIAQTYLPSWLTYRGVNMSLLDYLRLVPIEYLDPDNELYVDIVKPPYGKP